MLRRIATFVIEKYHDFQFSKNLRKYNLSHAKKIETWTTKKELETLFYHALLCKPKANAIEIGSYLGASSCYIVAGLAQINGHLTCVDTWKNETIPGGEIDTYEEFLNNIKPVSEYITPKKINSSLLTKDDFKEKFEFVFIDGDHSYKAVKSDFSLIETITEKGAKVFFHDSIYYEGVARVIGEALASEKWNIGGTVDNLFWIIKK